MKINICILDYKIIWIIISGLIGFLIYSGLSASIDRVERKLEERIDIAIQLNREILEEARKPLELIVK